MSDFSTASVNALEWLNLPGDDATRTAADEEKVRRGFWKKLKRSMSYVPFAEDAVAAYYAAFDAQTPLKVRAILLASLAYFILPVDVMPDVFPVIGFTDDAAVLMGALRLLSEHVKPQHHDAARDALDDLRRDRD